jgi:hypothetical protein
MIINRKNYSHRIESNNGEEYKKDNGKGNKIYKHDYAQKFITEIAYLQINITSLKFSRVTKHVSPTIIYHHYLDQEKRLMTLMNIYSENLYKLSFEKLPFVILESQDKLRKFG